MSEPPVPTQVELLNNALFTFTACISTALNDVCSWGITIGEQYVPFDPDDEDNCGTEEAGCTQLWTRVIDVTPTAIPDSFGGTGCAMDLRISVEVGILRCIELHEGGEAPTATEVHVASMQSMEDMQNILCAALNCKDEDDKDIFSAITVGQWQPIGPLGGQYGGTWTFTLETL